VNDNQTFIEGMSAFLVKKHDYENISSFTSGTDLFGNINNYIPDLILLDIEMPGLNSIETAQRLNYYYPKPKLITITMYQDRVYLKQLIEAGFRRFVSKNDVSENLPHGII
jgi:DNA-binding NarL/FixJ family response regulator